MKVIDISKNQIKFLQSLKLKKFRQKYNKFIVEGHKMVQELQRDRPEIIDKVMARDEWISKYGVSNVDYLKATEKQMGQVSLLKTACDVAALVHMDESFYLSKSIHQGKYMYLYELNDPGNCGTLFRIADWFGLNGVILSPQSVDVFNPKSVQASMGSVLRVPHLYTESSQLLNNNHCIATSLNGDQLNQFQFPDDFILFFGNESKGLPDEIVSQCTSSLLIDNSFSLGAESLNIAISAGIFMHQMRLK